MRVRCVETDYGGGVPRVAGDFGPSFIGVSAFVDDGLGADCPVGLLGSWTEFYPEVCVAEE